MTRSTDSSPAAAPVNGPATYDATSRRNHWITAIAFIGLMSVGFFLANVELPREQRAPIMMLHKSFGTLLFFWALWRVTYRLRQGFPPPAAAMPGWQLMLSKAVHWGLLAAVIIMPTSGLAGSMFGGRGIELFGVVKIPAFMDSDAISDVAHEVHELAAFALLGLLVLHIGAALKHHLVDRDGTLTRMLRG